MRRGWVGGVHLRVYRCCRGGVVGVMLNATSLLTLDVEQPAAGAGSAAAGIERTLSPITS